MVFQLKLNQPQLLGTPFLLKLYTFPCLAHTAFTNPPQTRIMRNTFTKFVLAAAITLLPALSFAQAPEGQGGRRGGDPEQMLTRQLAAMKEAVGLTEDQEKAIRPILADQQKKGRELMANGPSDESREQMMKLMTESTTKIKKVLKEDQIEKFDKFQAERRNRRGPGGPGGPGGPPPPAQN